MAYRFSFRACALMTLSVPAFCCSQAAFAQATTPAADESASTEIVVTANRREQKIVDVPLSVTAISGDSLNRKGLTQIENFASEVPGFSIENQGRIGIRLVLRGQNTGGSGATVATMIDDVVLSSASALSRGSTVTPNLDLYDIERIEVLRGPQGTLYGATAQGGLLKYVTKKPNLSRFEGSGEVGIESVRFGNTGYSAKGMVNIPIATDVAALRVVGYYNDVPGYVDNPLLGLKAVNAGKLYGGRASLLLQPTAELSIRLTAAKQKDRYGSEGYTQLVGSPLVADGETPASYGLLGNRPVENLQYAGQTDGNYEFYNGVIDYDFGGVALTSSTSLAKGSRKFFVDASNGPAGPGVTLAGALGFFFGEPIVAIIDQDNRFRKFNQEIRLASNGDGPVVWQLGAFYSNEDVVFDQDFKIRAASDTSRPVTIVPGFGPLSGLGLGRGLIIGNYEELSGFGEATFKAGKSFELSLGGRYSSIEQLADYTTFPGLFNGPTTVVNPTIKSSESKFTFSVAPRIRLSEDVSLYARVATGYRPGGPLTTPGAGTLFPASFGPDTTTNYEVGTKGQLLNGLLSFDVAVYQIDWNDIQIITQYINPNSGQAFFVTGNGGTASSRGLEWSFSARPLRGLDISWNGAVTDAKLTSDAPALGGLKGDNLPYVPKFSSSVSIDYAVPLGGELAANFGGSWSHVGDRSGDFSASGIISNNPPIPGYDTFDLRVGLSFSRFRIDALARNINDSRGLVSYRNNAGFNATSGSGAIIQPRTFALKLSAQF